MRRLAFTPRWLGGLVLCVLLASVFTGLGRWQWDRGEGSGGLQNTAYAFNWWLFAVLALGFWGKALREAASRTGQSATHRRGPPSPAAPGPGESLRGYARARGPRTPAPVRSPVLPDAWEDPDVAAWNDWLAELHARPRR